MPLTPSGSKVLASMSKSYGPKKGKSVFYASINSGRLKKRSMEGSRSSSRGRQTTRRSR